MAFKRDDVVSRAHVSMHGEQQGIASRGCREAKQPPINVSEQILGGIRQVF